MTKYFLVLGFFLMLPPNGEVVGGEKPGLNAPQGSGFEIGPLNDGEAIPAGPTHCAFGAGSGDFVRMDDGGEPMWMKINNKTVEFHRDSSNSDQTHISDVYRSSEAVVTLEMARIKSTDIDANQAYETYEGNVTVLKNGQSKTWAIYGDCGP